MVEQGEDHHVREHAASENCDIVVGGVGHVVVVFISSHPTVSSVSAVLVTVESKLTDQHRLC
jgi:hypothetical protein